MTPTFKEWLSAYEDFKRTVDPIVGADLPTEVSELERENQSLPALLAAAHDHAAMAELFYARAKESRILTANFKWSLKSSSGLVSTLKQRCFSVSAALRRGL